MPSANLHFVQAVAPALRLNEAGCYATLIVLIAQSLHEL